MKKSSRMSVIHPHAAGVDIGAEFHVVAVPPDADAAPVRTFQRFTGDLHRMSDW
ncbi:IS110 family transposase, partial [Salmonella enterica]|nr:IS110 family transposase [Salmonella enterica]